MAKKKVDKPWEINTKLVKKNASKSIKDTTSKEHQEVEEKKTKMNFKFLKISIPMHRKLKILAVNKGMKLKEFTEWLVEKEWEEEDGGQSYH